MAPISSAYHGPPGGDGTASPQQQGPGNGHIALCEDFMIGQPGVGGMCYMSTDKEDLDGSVGVADEDWYWDHDNDPSTAQVAASNADVKDNNIWSCVQDSSGAEGFYRVGSDNHGMLVAAGGRFYYKELLADWLAGGHVESPRPTRP